MGKFYNFRMSNGLKPVTKSDKKNTATSKRDWLWRHESEFWHIIFLTINGQFGAYRNWILDTWPPKLTFWLIKTYYTIVSSKGSFLPKSSDFLLTNADISKLRVVLILTSIFYQTTYVRTYMCVLTYQSF